MQEETKKFRDKVQRVRAARLQIVEGVLALGRHLELVKLGFAGDDAAFEKWLRKECGWRPQAFELLSAAQVFRDIDGLERFDSAALLLLAAAPPAAQHQARKLARRGVPISFSRARRLVAKISANGSKEES